jgi:hypothetical protein
MCGIDFVTPFQGLNLFSGCESQGVALGYHVLRLWRGELQPKGLRHDSPGQSEAPPRDTPPQMKCALKGRDKTGAVVLVLSTAPAQIMEQYFF